MVGGRILVVDDEELMATVISECLSFGGYEPQTASSGSEGLRQIRQRLPDLLITDMRMPEMDGYEFARLVRQEFDLPIIMLTGAAFPDRKLPGPDVVDAYLAKPVALRDLLATVGALLNGTRAGAKAGAGRSMEGNRLVGTRLWAIRAGPEN